MIGAFGGAGSCIMRLTQRHGTTHGLYVFGVAPQQGLSASPAESHSGRERSTSPPETPREEAETSRGHPLETQGSQLPPNLPLRGTCPNSRFSAPGIPRLLGGGSCANGSNDGVRSFPSRGLGAESRHQAGCGQATPPISCAVETRVASARGRCGSRSFTRGRRRRWKRHSRSGCPWSRESR